MSPTVRAVERADAPAAADLHCRALAGYFLPELGPAVLTSLYRGMLDTGAAFGFAAGHLDGFVLATTDTGALFKRVLRARWPRLLPLIAARLVARPRLLPRVLETALYPGRAQSKDPLPELLVIAVDERARRGGIGRALVAALDDHLRARGVGRYEVSVDAASAGAVAFYRSLGFAEARRFPMYGGEWLAMEKEVR